MSNEQKITNNIKLPNTDLDILKKHFPQCFDKDGNFELEKFKNNLTEKEIHFSTESYGLEWLGKSYARLLAADNATTLLKENHAHNAKAENQNAENLLIKGDNLEVLKHLANAYYEKIKMIYIDPPYNTGGDGFVYADDRKFKIEDLQELIGVSEEKAKRILSFTHSKSNSHSAWLTFMYPRLYIAKQLLKEDGVIFISIDDNEVAQLRLLMDEVFGEENFVATYKWNKTSTPPSLSKKVRQKYEFILCYIKNGSKEIFNGGTTDGGDMPLLNDGNNIDILEFPKDKVNFKIEGLYKPGIYDRVELLNEIEVIDNISNKDFKLKGPFKWKQSNLKEEIEKGTIFHIKSEKFAVRYEKQGERTKVPSDIISKKECEVGTNEDANKELTNIFGMDGLFSYPKTTSLIKYLSNFRTSDTDLILDFFAGSGTTGDAVMQLNAADGGNRKYILVQLPEAIDPKKNKAAYDFVASLSPSPLERAGEGHPTIFEITKERLIRAAAKIKTEKPEYKGNMGFKIFETMPIWEDYNLEADVFSPQITLFDETKLTEEDIKALLTTWKTYDGIALTQALETINLGGYTAHLANGKLYLMYKGFTTDNLVALLEKTDSDKTFEPRVIIAFGYHFESKNLREIAESVKHYTNKKKTDIDFITRY